MFAIAIRVGSLTGVIPRLAVLLTVACLLFFVAVPTMSAQRVALVIGNSNYDHVPILANPRNDASDIGAALERLGFVVTPLENVGYDSFRKSLQEFKRAASVSKVAAVFYAGHGIEVDQRNFLVPVDARLASDQDVEFETVPLDLVMWALDGASELRLVILDACRDNPFAAKMQRSGATRSIGRGLARLEPSEQTLVAYSAEAGTVASDGDGRNSPYTAALLRHIEEPGLELDLMFRHVRDSVLSSTGGSQRPFTYGSLSSQGAYLTGRPAVESTTVGQSNSGDKIQSVSDRVDVELAFWESIKNSKDPADFQAYLTQFPSGIFTTLVRNRLKRLTDLQETAHHVAAIPTVPTTGTSPDSSLLPPAPEMIERSLNLEREDRRQLQIGLAALGFDPGPADGVFGHGTRGAISKWQTSRFAKATGYLNVDEVKILLDTAKTAPHPKPRKDLLQDALKIISMALTAADRIEDSVDRSFVFNQIAIAQAEAGDVRGAEKTFMKSLAAAERIVEDWHRDLMFGRIVDGQARAGMFREALTTAERIEALDDRVTAFVSIAEAQEKAGDARGADKLIARALQLQNVQEMFTLGMEFTLTLP